MSLNTVCQKYFLTEFVPLNLMQSYYGALKSKITVNADDEILQLSHFSFIGKNGNTLFAQRNIKTIKTKKDFKHEKDNNRQHLQ